MKKIILLTALLCSATLWAKFDLDEYYGTDSFTYTISDWVSISDEIQVNTHIYPKRYANEKYGNTVNVSGDFNNDGYKDLIIGVPGKIIHGTIAGGAISITYGNTNGLYLKESTWIDQNTAGVSGGVENGDEFGYSIAVGDFNGDSYDDIIVGIPGEAIGSIENAGAVVVMYGSENGISTSVSRGFTQNSIEGSGTNSTGNRFGEVLQSGDFNYDGYVDIAIGSPHAGSGKITILYGSSTGLSANNNLIITKDNEGINSLVSADNLFGETLAIGDFNNDSYDDLAIGMPKEMVNGRSGAGKVLVLNGSNEGINFSSSYSLDQNSPHVPGGAETNDGFGMALASGDINKDGFDDLVVGVPTESIGEIKNAGMITLIYGAQDGLNSGKNAQGVSENSGHLNGVSTDNYFGEVLSIGDTNNDGYDDVIIGIPHKDFNIYKSGELERSIKDTGAIMIFYGSDNGLSVASARWFDQGNLFIPGGPEAGDRMGTSLSIGDYNGDGKGDIVESTPFESIGSLQNSGTVHLMGVKDDNMILSASDGSTVSLTHKLDLYSKDIGYSHYYSPWIQGIAYLDNGFYISSRNIHIEENGKNKDIAVRINLYTPNGSSIGSIRLDEPIHGQGLSIEKIDDNRYYIYMGMTNIRKFELDTTNIDFTQIDYSKNYKLTISDKISELVVPNEHTHITPSLNFEKDKFIVEHYVSKDANTKVQTRQVFVLNKETLAVEQSFKYKDLGDGRPTQSIVMKGNQVWLVRGGATPTLYKTLYVFNLDDAGDNNEIILPRELYTFGASDMSKYHSIETEGLSISPDGDELLTVMAVRLEQKSAVTKLGVYKLLDI